jgi:hypothetical protein
VVNMERYYMVQGPEKFEETPECVWWLNSNHWAKDVIVVYAERQDENKPGKLYKIVYKPVAKMQLPAHTDELGDRDPPVQARTIRRGGTMDSGKIK